MGGLPVLTRKFVVLAAASSLALSFGTAASAQKVVDFPGYSGGRAEPLENQFVCMFAQGKVSKASVRAEAAKVAGPQGGRVTLTYANTFQGFALSIAPEGLARMQARNPHIASCEQDIQVSLALPSARPGGGGGGSTTESVPGGITFVHRGTAPTSNIGAGKRAWIVDTGIDADHPDLIVSSTLSRNYVTSGSLGTPPWDDQNGHGSHVSGTIAALVNNGIGVVGVAPGAEVVAIRVLDRNGRGSCSVIAKAIDDLAVVAAPSDVVNMSLGCPVFAALDTAVLSAASDHGIRFAIAAGNDGSDRKNSSPARVDHPNVYTIAALTTSFNALTSWSNYGVGTDFAEPGSSVLSTWKGGGYNTISGTSMASPHAAGLLLLGVPVGDGSVTDRVGTVIPIGKVAP